MLVPGVHTGEREAGTPTRVYQEAYSRVYSTHHGTRRHIAGCTVPTQGTQGGIQPGIPPRVHGKLSASLREKELLRRESLSAP